LFITDPNKSPFNVGTRLALEDFDREQVADLNRRYGGPPEGDEAGGPLHHPVGGPPYPVRRPPHQIASHRLGLGALEARAPDEEWIFGDHLRYILALHNRDPDLREAARAVLQGQPCPTLASFYRLRSAGVIAGDFEHDARPRCRLYAIYLQRHLG